MEQAFKNDLINDAEGWRRLKESRQLTSHTYESSTAEEIAKEIVEEYYDLFQQLEKKLEKLKSK